jgi:hypothetical protein
MGMDVFKRQLLNDLNKLVAHKHRVALACFANRVTGA